MAKRRRELTEAEKALFNPEYLAMHIKEEESNADGITNHRMYQGDGRSALNDFWNKYTSGDAKMSELFKNKY